MSIWTVKIKAEENQNPRFMDMFGCIVMCSIENNCIDNTPCSIEAEDGEAENMAENITECIQFFFALFDPSQWELMFEKFGECQEKKMIYAQNQDYRSSLQCQSECPEDLIDEWENAQCAQDGNCLSHLGWCSGDCTEKYCSDDSCYGGKQAKENYQEGSTACQAINIKFFTRSPYSVLTATDISHYEGCLKHMRSQIDSGNAGKLHSCVSSCISKFVDDNDLSDIEDIYLPKFSDMDVCSNNCREDNNCGEDTTCGQYLDSDAVDQLFGQVEYCRDFYTELITHTEDWKKLFNLFENCAEGMVDLVTNSDAGKAFTCQAGCVKKMITYYTSSPCINTSSCYVNNDECIQTCQIENSCRKTECFNTNNKDDYDFSKEVLPQNPDCKKLDQQSQNRENPYQTMTDESIELYNNCLDYLEKNHKTDETKDVLKCWGKCFDQMEKNIKEQKKEASTTLLSVSLITMYLLILIM